MKIQNTKYNLTLIYGIGPDDLDGIVNYNSEDYGEAEEEKIENKALETLKNAFAPLGGQFIGKNQFGKTQFVDVAYYTGDYQNYGDVGFPFKFENITKDQLVQIFNVVAPFKNGLTFYDLMATNWNGEEWDKQNADQLIEIIKDSIEEGNYTIITFEIN